MELDMTNSDAAPADEGDTAAEVSEPPTEAGETPTEETSAAASEEGSKEATPAPALTLAERSQRRAPARTVQHLTPDERAARGKAARAEVSRRSHGEWEPSPARPDPIVLLEDQARTRVPELVPIRYGRMLTSPFAFFRGAAYIMAADLAGHRAPGCTRSCAATRTSRTSAASRRRTAGSCSASTTSTRRYRGRSSGT